MSDKQAQVVVLGSGPGGYTAAFRAADLGLKVILIERYESIGGVCLNVGCIPSKALLHASKVLDEANSMKDHGIDFGKPKVDTKKLAAWKDSVITKLTGGLKALAKQRKVEIVHGYGKFTGPNEIAVEGADGKITTVGFENCIIAAGSRPVDLPFIPEDERIFDSTGALTLNHIPKKLLVLGGGIIGLEMATVYHALGSEIDVVEFTPQLMGAADKDIAKVYQKWISKRYNKVMLETSVVSVDAKKDGLHIGFEGKQAPEGGTAVYDGLLVACGRRPNGLLLDADKAGVNVTERGFIEVDQQQRTNVPHIFAIGDIVGQPMLAHKAVPEGKIAAEVISGKKHFFDPRCIPSVAYTDPEVAWVGETEATAKEKGIKYEKGSFPWAASGRSLSLGRDEGVTKVLFDENNRIIGAGIVGPNAGDLIAEAGLAIEMGADAEDISLTIHPHPTLSETIAMATEAFEGTITDLYMPKRDKK